MSATSRRPREGAIAFGAILAATAVLFWPMLTGLLTGEPRWFEWDVPEQYWPDLVFLCDSLHAAELPYWNPYDRAGYPYYADPQAGIYHPLNWLVCAFGSSPAPAWADARVVFGFSLAGLFGLGWLRELKLAWSSAIVGAVLLMAAPFMRHNWELNLTTAFAWSGAMLWAAERLVCRRRAVDGVWLALAVAGCAWVGSPPALWQASTFTSFYIVIRCVSLRGELPGMELRRLAAALVIAGLLAAGLIGVVFVPGLTLSEHSVQAGRSFAAIADGGLDPGYLVALAVPLSGNHLHLGAIALTLGAFAVRGKRPSVVPMLVLAVLSVWMCLGEAGGLFRFAYDWIPGVELFRLPHRYEAWLGPISAYLAAQGIESLPKWKIPKPDLRWGIPVGLGLGIWMGMFVTRGVPALLLGLVLTALAARRGELHRAWFGGLLALCVLLEVTVAMPADRHLRAGTRPGLDATPLESTPGTEHAWRYMDEFGVSCRSGTRHGRREFRGYQDPLTLSRFERFLSSLREHPQLGMQLNVRYALQGPHFIHGWNRHFLPPPDELARLPNAHRDNHTIEFGDALPFAYWVPWSSAARIDDPDEAMEMLREHAPARVALLEGTLALPDLERGAPGGQTHAGFEEVDAYDVVVEKDRVRFSLDAPQDGVVVVNEAWYPGWHARVDGVETPVARANVLVRAIPIERGPHVVDMIFAPRDGRVWRWAWAISLALALIWLGVARRARRATT